MMLTPTALLMLTTVSKNGMQLLFDRLTSTGLGILAALIVTLVWQAEIQRRQDQHRPGAVES